MSVRHIPIFMLGEKNKWNSDSTYFFHFIRYEINYSVFPSVNCSIPPVDW